jgi:hypothetical protein
VKQLCLCEMQKHHQQLQQQQRLRAYSNSPYCGTGCVFQNLKSFCVGSLNASERAGCDSSSLMACCSATAALDF